LVRAAEVAEVVLLMVQPCFEEAAVVAAAVMQQACLLGEVGVGLDLGLCCSQKEVGVEEEGTFWDPCLCLVAAEVGVVAI